MNRQDRADINPFETTAADRRAAAVRAEEENLALRRKQIAAQTAPQHSAEQRIKIWEQLHAVWLPRDAQHRLVGVIAAQTGLTVEQIRAEQVRRAAPPPPPAV